MIRINLLPFRAARKKENIRRQITVFGLTVVFLLLVLIYYFFSLNSQLSQLKADEQRLQAELVTFEKTLQKISELEKKIKEIKTKLAVIKDLEKGKTGPLRLLDEIAMAVPKDKLWLTSFSESAGVLKLTGTAMDNETVALFMTNLEKSEHITGVELQSTKLTNLAQYRLNVADFVLECKTYAYKEKPKPAPPAPAAPKK
jgi:type IV pilus assembly protein PilN